jgi:Protein of unknown function (DUF2800)
MKVSFKIDSLATAETAVAQCALLAETYRRDQPKTAAIESIESDEAPAPVAPKRGSGRYVRTSCIKIVTTVVQPRFGCNADPIRSAIVHADEMAEFAIELIKCAETAMRHDAPFVAGSWCKFCAAKNTCATFQGFQRTELYREFDLTPS